MGSAIVRFIPCFNVQAVFRTEDEDVMAEPERPGGYFQRRGATIPGLHQRLEGLNVSVAGDFDFPTFRQQGHFRVGRDD